MNAAELAGWAEMFRGFARLEASGRHPLYERLAGIIAEQPAILALMEEAPPKQRLPTLLFAALHRVVLDHPDEPLARWYPSVTGEAVPGTDPTAALLGACAAHEHSLRAMLRTRSTQTNEVARCAALLPAFALAARELARPLAVIELGASAGLNLNLPRYAYDYGDGRIRGEQSSRVSIRCRLRGPIAAPLPDEPLPIASAVGVDLEPIDPRDEAASGWLRACIYADVSARLERLDGALAIARESPPDVRRGDLLEELPRLLAETPPTLAPCVVHTWTILYLSADEREMLATELASAGSGRDLAWVSAEPPGAIPGLREPPPDPALPFASMLTLTTFRDGRRADTVLARAHPHCEWMQWLAADDIG